MARSWHSDIKWLRKHFFWISLRKTLVHWTLKDYGTQGKGGFFTIFHYLLIHCIWLLISLHPVTVYHTRQNLKVSAKPFLNFFYSLRVIYWITVWRKKWGDDEMDEKSFNPVLLYSKWTLKRRTSKINSLTLGLNEERLVGRSSHAQNVSIFGTAACCTYSESNQTGTVSL